MIFRFSSLPNFLPRAGVSGSTPERGAKFAAILPEHPKGISSRRTVATELRKQFKGKELRQAIEENTECFMYVQIIV